MLDIISSIVVCECETWIRWEVDVIYWYLHFRTQVQTSVYLIQVVKMISQFIGSGNKQLNKK